MKNRLSPKLNAKNLDLVSSKLADILINLIKNHPELLKNIPSKPK